jgi:hypothetical protein
VWQLAHRHASISFFRTAKLDGAGFTYVASDGAIYAEWQQEKRDSGRFTAWLSDARTRK